MRVEPRGLGIALRGEVRANLLTNIGSVKENTV